MPTLLSQLSLLLCSLFAAQGHGARLHFAHTLCRSMSDLTQHSLEEQELQSLPVKQYHLLHAYKALDLLQLHANASLSFPSLTVQHTCLSLLTTWEGTAGRSSPSPLFCRPRSRVGERQQSYLLPVQSRI